MNWQLSRCRQLRSGAWSYRAKGLPHSGQGQTVSPCSAQTSTRCSLTLSSTLATVHGLSSPRRWRYNSVSRMRPFLPQAAAAGRASPPVPRLATHVKPVGTIFEFIAPAIHPYHALTVFALADDYSFAILQSETHGRWCIAR